MRPLILLLAATCATFAPAQENKTAPLTAQELQTIWNVRFIQIDDEGARQALADIRWLVQAPDLAVPFFQSKLKPAPQVDARRVSQAIADLDSSSFPAREQAMKDLEALGTTAGPFLEKKLKEQVPLEVRQRLQTLQQRIDSRGLTPDDLRGLRAIEALEGIGSPAARSILETLAQGGPGAVLTERARQALANLAGRGK